MPIARRKSSVVVAPKPFFRKVTNADSIALSLSNSFWRAMFLSYRIMDRSVQIKTTPKPWLKKPRRGSEARTASPHQPQPGSVGHGVGGKNSASADPPYPELWKPD